MLVLQLVNYWTGNKIAQRFLDLWRYLLPEVSPLVQVEVLGVLQQLILWHVPGTRLKLFCPVLRLLNCSLSCFLVDFSFMREVIEKGLTDPDVGVRAASIKCLGGWAEKVNTHFLFFCGLNTCHFWLHCSGTHLGIQS